MLRGATEMALLREISGGVGDLFTGRPTVSCFARHLSGLSAGMASAWLGHARTLSLGGLAFAGSPARGDDSSRPALLLCGIRQKSPSARAPNAAESFSRLSCRQFARQTMV